jgi:hypothetical protein
VFEWITVTNPDASPRNILFPVDRSVFGDLPADWCQMAMLARHRARTYYIIRRTCIGQWGAGALSGDFDTGFLFCTAGSPPAG